MQTASDLATIDTINRRLNDEYRVIDGRPIYRIVWSDDQLEMRKGTYSDWYGHIFIREVKNITRLVKKYWYFDKPSWVLEKLSFYASNAQMKEVLDELVEARNGSYEPVYRFYRESTKQNLPVNMRVVDFIVYSLHNPGRPDHAKAQEVEEREEVAYFEEELGKGERSPLFVAENSVFVSSNQMTFSNSKPLIYTEPMTLGEQNVAYPTS